MQIVSLAGGLPLQWPENLEIMFASFATLSSAGSNLIIPDCELTTMKTADAFFMKQYFFAGIMPFLVFVVVLCWRLLYTCCKKSMSLTKKKLNDYTILSLVLMTFLAYPMLTRLTLSTLKCPWVGGQMWLMADLQEPCFQGRHMFHVLALTVPQLIVYVIGLPLISVIFITRNIKNLHHKSFYTRYGLLYLGYRDERAWWEGVVAIRKVAIVAISTFGTLLGVVDIQAFLGLLVVFLSIVAHLVGLPFDLQKKNTVMLHHLEFVALTVCWMTFWGGLLFFLGHEKNGTIHRYVLQTCSVLLVVANVTLLIVSGYLFGREYRRDKVKAHLRRETKRSQLDAIIEHALTTSGDQKDTDKLNDIKKAISVAGHEQLERIGAALKIPKDPNHTSVKVKKPHHKMMSSIKRKLTQRFSNLGTPGARRHSIGHTKSTVSKAHSIHQNYSQHEAGFNKKTKERQERAKRKTQLRLKARIRLKDSKALHELTIFHDLEEAEVDLIIDQMDHIVRYKGDILCHQHDLSDAFFVILKGSAIITIDIDDEDEEEQEGEEGEEGEEQVDKEEEKTKEKKDLDHPESRPEQFEVGKIETLGFFGEEALLIITDKDGSEKPSVGYETVVVETEKCELLRLKRSAFKKIMEIDEHAFKDRHHDHASVLDQLKDTKIERVKTNRMALKRRRSSLQIGGGLTTSLTTVVPVLLGPPKGVPNLLKLNGGVKEKNERSLYS